MSNASTMAAAFRPIEQANYDTIIQNTWGHLAPQKNKTYRGKLLVARSEYNSGKILLISSKMEIDSSPWFYDSAYEWLYSIKDQIKEGSVYEIEATFRNYRWWGKMTKIYS